MATFRKRWDRWHVQIRRRGHPSITRSFLSKADAQRWAREAERQIDRGELTLAHGGAGDRSISVRDLFLRYAESESRKKRGGPTEAIRLRALARGAWTVIDVRLLSAPVLAKWRDARSREVGPATVLRELGLMRRVFAVARNEWGVCADLSAFDRVTRPRAPAHRARRLSREEERYLRAACAAARNQWLLPAIELATETAMRRGELLAMRWRDVDFERALVLLRTSKNGRGRIIPLSPMAQATLQRLRERACGEAVLQTTPEALKLAFRRAVQRAREVYLEDTGAAASSDFLVDLHFHDLRHEATSRLFELGLNTMEVASVTGHETLQMLRRYTHLRPEDLVRRLRGSSTVCEERHCVDSEVVEGAGFES